METHIRSEQAADTARITEVTRLAFRDAGTRPFGSRGAATSGTLILQTTLKAATSPTHRKESKK